MPGIFQPWQHHCTRNLCQVTDLSYLWSAVAAGARTSSHTPPARRGKNKAQGTQKGQKCSPPRGTSLPLSGAPEPSALSGAPFRVAGWELLLLLLTFCLEFESFLNGSLNLPQGFCRCPIFIIESAHQLPWERRSIKTTVFLGRENASFWWGFIFNLLFKDKNKRRCHHGPILEPN